AGPGRPDGGLPARRLPGGHRPPAGRRRVPGADPGARGGGTLMRALLARLLRRPAPAPRLVYVQWAPGTPGWSVGPHRLVCDGVATYCGRDNADAHAAWLARGGAR